MNRTLETHSTNRRTRSMLGLLGSLVAGTLAFVALSALTGAFTAGTQRANATAYKVKGSADTSPSPRSGLLFAVYVVESQEQAEWVRNGGLSGPSTQRVIFVATNLQEYGFFLDAILEMTQSGTYFSVVDLRRH